MHILEFVQKNLFQKFLLQWENNTWKSKDANNKLYHPWPQSTTDKNYFKHRVCAI